MLRIDQTEARIRVLLAAAGVDSRRPVFGETWDVFKQLAREPVDSSSDGGFSSRPGHTRLVDQSASLSISCDSLKSSVPMARMTTSSSFVVSLSSKSPQR